MNENSFGKKINTVPLLTEISPIHESRGIKITKKEQIKDLVEKPLVKACEIFWDKNIKTYESSANNQDIKEGHCYIAIDFDSLSENNKNISKQYGEPHLDININILRIKIPVIESATVDDISNGSVEIANKFQKQKATWISGTTLKQQLDYNYSYIGEKYPKKFSEEKERLSSPGAWEEECKRLGRYFDKETQTAYASEEYFKKVKDDSNKPKFTIVKKPKFSIMKKPQITIIKKKNDLDQNE